MFPWASFMFAVCKFANGKYIIIPKELYHIAKQYIMIPQESYHTGRSPVHRSTSFPVAIAVC